MTEIRKLEEAIAILESQREVLGEKLLKSAMARLQARLSTLRAQQSLDRNRRPITILAMRINHITNAPEATAAGWWQQANQIALTWGGHIEQKRNDTMIISWGIDEIREDDVERAIRAGLELRRAAGTYFNAAVEGKTEKTAYSYQAGIYTGEVIIGQDIFDQDSNLMVESFNIARHLLNNAPLNGLIISDSSYRLVQGVFNIYKISPISIPGFQEELIAYVALSAKPRPFRIPTRGVEGIMTKTVGQSEQLEQLMAAWLDVVNNRHARCVTIIGEAGVGKSRLMDDMRSQLEYRGEPFRYFEGRSTPQSANIPFALVRDILSNRFEIYASDTPAVIREKFVAGICEFADEDGIEKAHIIGELIGFNFSTSPYISGIHRDASQIHQRAQQYLIDFFTAVSNQRVTALFIDNIHWADSSSLDLLQNLAIGLRHQPLMMIVMARPGLFNWYSGWGGMVPNHQFLNLAPLTLEEARELTADILQKMKFVPQLLSESIVKGSGGNPYYIEETFKLLVDDGVIMPDEPDWQLIPEKLVTCRIPMTINEAVLARIEKQSPAELEILYAASIVGRTFWDDMVAFMVNKERAATNANLLALQKKELLFRKPVSTFNNTEEYIFKHHIMHQITYSSVPPDLQQRYHARAAEWLKKHSGAHLTEQTAWIAYHLDKAGEKEQAGSYYLHAGLDAAHHYANRDAAYLLSRALELIPENNYVDRFKALQAIIRLHSTLKEYDQQPANLKLAMQLAKSIGDDLHLAQAHYLQASHEDALGQYAEALESCRTAIKYLSSASPSRLEADAHFLAGSILVKLENLPEGRNEILAALKTARSLGLSQMVGTCLSSLGNICWIELKFDEAVDLHTQALHQYQEIIDLRGAAYAHLCIGVVHNSDLKFAYSEHHFQQSLEISRRIGERLGEARTLNNWGDLYSARGDYEDAIRSITQALAIFREVDHPIGINASLANLGFLNLQNGQYSNSLDYYMQWFNYCQARPDPTGMALACTGLAQILTTLGQFGRARNYLNQAMTFFSADKDVSGQCRVKSLQGRSAYLSGDIPNALPYLLEVIQMPMCAKNLESLLLSHLTLGHIYTDQGKFSLAHQSYQLAEGISAQMRDSHFLLEPLAALARLAYKEEKLDVALDFVHSILKRITAAPIDFSDAVFWTYLICAEVLIETNAPELRDVVYRAQRLMYNIAEKISDPDIRRSFLENVPANRKLASVRVV